MKKMKVVMGAAVMAACAVMFAGGAALHASKTDERIESSAKASYIFKTYLKDDDIKIQSKNGVVTLSGGAANAAEKDLVTKLVGDVNGVKSVNNQMTVN